MSHLKALGLLRKAFSGSVPDGAEPGSEDIFAENRIIPIGHEVVEKCATLTSAAGGYMVLVDAAGVGRPLKDTWAASVIISDHADRLRVIGMRGSAFISAARAAQIDMRAHSEDFSAARRSGLALVQNDTRLLARRPRAASP